MELVEGLLAPDELQQALEHLAACAGCRALAAEAGGDAEQLGRRGLRTTATGEVTSVHDPPGAKERTGELLRCGEILDGRYLIKRFIARGGMGLVYEASHLRLERCFAIKVLVGSLAGNAEAVARLEREARIASGLSHPHIVEVVDCNRTGTSVPYLVMELLAGQPLDAFIQAGGAPADLSFVAPIVYQVSSALSAVHERGVVHRDLKPSNIFRLLAQICG